MWPKPQQAVQDPFAAGNAWRETGKLLWLLQYDFKKRASRWKAKVSDAVQPVRGHVSEHRSIVPYRLLYQAECNALYFHHRT